MTKKQYAITILLFVGTWLYITVGASKATFDPVNIIVYCLAAVLIVIVVLIMLPPRYCPNCGAQLPRIRIPNNFNEGLFGGTTCPKCKSEIDSNGRVVK